MKSKGWDTVCSACTAGVSVVCMSSMAASLVAAGVAAGAGAAGMAGMGSMGEMGSENAAPAALPLLPSLFEGLGLGFLNRLPNEILQPLLVVLLTLSVAAAYVAYRGHRRPHALVLTAVSALAMYLSIYVWMSDDVYFGTLVGLVGAGLWGTYLARRPATVP